MFLKWSPDSPSAPGSCAVTRILCCGSSAILSSGLLRCLFLFRGVFHGMWFPVCICSCLAFVLSTGGCFPCFMPLLCLRLPRFMFYTNATFLSCSVYYFSGFLGVVAYRDFLFRLMWSSYLEDFTGQILHLFCCPVNFLSVYVVGRGAMFRTKGYFIERQDSRPRRGAAALPATRRCGLPAMRRPPSGFLSDRLK